MSSRKTTCGGYFKEYCESTSIHGFKYFGEERSVFERLWWAVIFGACLCGCSFMIFSIYQKFEKSPVIVSFATKETPIYNIPFPAVTICPETKTKKQDFEQTLKKKSFLDHVYPCMFMGTPLNCSDIFLPVITDEGVCYSFNLLDHSQIFTPLVDQYKGYHSATEKSLTWTIEGYLNDSKDTYPRRALLSGASNGLIVLLSSPKDKPIQGNRVILHTPMRLPRLQQEYFRVPLDEAVVTAVKPVMINTSEAVKKYPTKKRDCCFHFERKLKFFQSYSQLNCQLECLANFTLQRCGCVSFFMPKEKTTRICTNGDDECVKNADIILQTEEIHYKFERKREIGAACDCMPLCTDLTYHTESSQTSWNWNKEKIERNNTHLSSLTVYFKFNHFITSERNELYGPTDFLANFGGLLSLFTGFSILSFMEIIYFLTVRVCCNIKLYGKWTGK